ncbi:hypothetical protein LENED_007389 [Lentinula edodes]|uniref:Uncharacterized protein n=1 Tax=Lentinula edodes TaxID=5353 RepID=A0A1Q3EE88_LENED|nr:hypothetical protein LENED_007389 [Lentinula edodes]
MDGWIVVANRTLWHVRSKSITGEIKHCLSRRTRPSILINVSGETEAENTIVLLNVTSCFVLLDTSRHSGAYVQRTPKSAKTCTATCCATNPANYVLLSLSPTAPDPPIKGWNALVLFVRMMMRPNICTMLYNTSKFDPFGDGYHPTPSNSALLSPLDNEFPMLSTFEEPASSSSLWDPNPVRDLEDVAFFALESVDVVSRRRLGPSCPRRSIPHAMAPEVPPTPPSPCHPEDLKRATVSAHDHFELRSAFSVMSISNCSPSLSAKRVSSPPLNALSLGSPRLNNAIELFQRAASPPSLTPTSPRWNRQNLLSHA